MLKLSENPPVLFPEHQAIHEITGQWWVAHTRARFEKAFAFDLAARQIPYFLPLIRRTFVSGGKRRQAMMPLFPSYVFFSGGAEQRHAALRTGRLAQIIEVAEQQRLIRQLSSLHQAISVGAPLESCPLVRRGQRCRVTAGALEGIEGVVVRDANVAFSSSPSSSSSSSSSSASTTRIVIEVTLLGQGASVEIDAHLLEPVEPSVQGKRASLQYA